MTPRARKIGLGLALAASAWLVATAEPPAPAAALSMPTRQTPHAWTAGRSPSAMPREARQAGLPDETADMRLVPRERLYPVPMDEQPGAGRDLFSARSWSRPAPKTVAAPTPLPPAAPALPYTVLGKQYDGQHWVVYLSRGDLTLLARTGTLLEGTYQVVDIAPPRLVLRYLPLDLPQELAIGDAR